MPKYYVTNAGARIANVYGYWGSDGVAIPPGRFAAVVDEEYLDGGYGPRAVPLGSPARVFHASHSEAAIALKAAFEAGELGPGARI